MGVIYLPDVAVHNGNMGVSGAWNNINANYQHIVIPVKSGDAIMVKGGGVQTYVGFLKSYTTPVDQASISYSDATEFTNRLFLDTTGTISKTTPSDANYFVIMVTQNGNNSAPSMLFINGYDCTKTLFENFELIASSTEENESDIAETNAKLNPLLDSVDIIKLTNLTPNNGNMGLDGKWNNISDNYQHIVIPVKPGDSITVKGGGTATYIGFLKSYTNPTDGASIDYSAATDYTERRFIDNTATGSFTVPSDVHYVVIMVKLGGNNCYLGKCLINGYDFAQTLYNNLAAIIGNVEKNTTNVATIIGNIDDMYTIAEREEYNGNLSTTGTYNNTTTGSYKLRVIPVKGGEYFKVKANVSKPLQYGALTTFGAITEDGAVPYSSATNWTSRRYLDANAVYEGNIPSDARYIILETTLNTNNAIPQVCVIGAIDYIKNIYGNIEQVYENNVKWCAMGDSITVGYVSYMSGSTPTSSVIPLKGWAHKVSIANHWELTNIAKGGTGYLFPGPGEQDDHKTAYYLARNTDFSGYNFVTLAYGINDWKANQPIGTINDDATAATPTTVMQAMKATIEAIMASNPLIKIIVILPLNCNGYNFDYGDITTNWGLGYEFSNSGTLESFVQKLIEVCNYYGIQYIDMTHYSVVNRQNLLSCLIDGVHPSEDAHTLLAGELAKKLTMN